MSDVAKDFYETLVEAGMTPDEAKAEVEALQDACRDGFPMESGTPSTRNAP